MSKQHASAELLAAMGDLLAAVRAAPLDHDTPSTAEAVTVRAEVADQLSDYILPRLVQLDAPLLTVVGGSTGAGKSTLVNSIVGHAVTEAGVLRPTTRSPVLVHHPDDAEWFSPDRLLPDLARVEDGSAHGLRLVATDAVPSGLAVLDAPDVDSVDQGNRDLAGQLLSAADLWLFVTSAARYADQVPWDYLRRASERATSVAVVLDRTADDAVVEVRGHLARMMTARGLSDSPLFTVPETDLTPDGLLPDGLATPISTWLHDLAADPEARRLVMGRTLDGAVRHIVLRTHDIADAMEDQVQVARELHDAVEAACTTSVREAAHALGDGSLMTGELLALWQEFVAAGHLVRAVEKPTSGLRGRFSSSVSGKGQRVADVVQAVENAIRSLLLDRGDTAAEQVSQVWSSSPAGRARLEQVASGGRASSDLRSQVESLVVTWRTQLAEAARAAAPEDGPTRIDDALVTALMTEVLTCRSTELERLSAVGRGVLNKVFGTDAVKTLVTDGHTDLVERSTQLLSAERDRYTAVFRSPDDVVAAQDAVRESARAAEHARHVDFLNGQITA